MTLESTSPWLLGRCSRQLRKSCAGANMYSREECVLIVETYFTSKAFTAVREAFSSAYPDKEVPNKTTISGHMKCLRQEICPASDSVDSSDASQR
jgi:hypothetical protein